MSLKRAFLFAFIFVFSFGGRSTCGQYQPKIFHASDIYVCENNRIHLSCGNEEVLEIFKASYGRHHRSICNSFRQSEANECSFRDTKAILQNKCDGLPNCEISASHLDLNISDPCAGVPKYLHVKSFCTRPPVKKRFICEDERHMLECPEGQQIRIVSARFGRDNYADGLQCAQGKMVSQQCPFVEVTASVQSKCNGYGSCLLKPNIAEFSDPCPFVFKLLKIEFYCQ